MELDFRKAEESDIPTIVGMMREFYFHERIAFDERAAGRALADIVSDGSIGAVYTIHANAEPAGYFCVVFGFSLEYQGRDCLLDELYVGERWRNGGIGTRVMEFIEDFAASKGLKALHLETKTHNERARSFYRKRGYRDHDGIFLTKRLGGT